MAKIRIRAGRGRGFIWVDSDASKWTGEQFKELQAARKAAAGNRIVSSGRGTSRRKLSDIPEPKVRPEYKGTITSGRGTGKKKK
ncbi:MAG: hypothetical protein IIA20_02970 [Thaumarchaeota archaeon]|nr:hypothetical protein [Nitrososphaerota archaeon]